MEPWYSIHWFAPEQWQQFRFAYSWVLYLIPALPVLFLLRTLLSRGRSQRLNVSTGAYLSQQSSWSWLRLLAPVSFYIAISFLLLALARPQICTRTA